MARTKQNAKKTLLCAVRFWSIGSIVNASKKYQDADQPTIPTLRRGVRYVVRKQGFSPAEIDKAERQLIAEGLLVRGGHDTAATVALTAKASKISCSTTKLAPWTDPQYPGAALAGCAFAGAKKPKKRRR